MTEQPKPRLVVFTGAGISAESGLKTFRDGNGLWENHASQGVPRLADYWLSRGRLTLPE